MSTYQKFSDRPIQMTLRNDDGILRLVEGVEKGARLEWRAAGVEYYKRGAFSGLLYASGANLVLRHAVSLHIPAISVRRVK